MSLRATSLSIAGAAGLTTAVASSGAAGTGAGRAAFGTAALFTALAAGAAVDLRLPTPLGADDRPHASRAGIVATVAVYVVFVGAFWWLELDSNDAHALLPWDSPGHGYLVAAAVVLTFGVGFALGLFRAVPLLMMVSLVLAFTLAARQESCSGWGCLAQDRHVGAWLASVFVPAIVFVGVGTRWAVEEFRPTLSGRVLLGVAVLVVVVVAAAAASAVGLSLVESAPGP